MFGYASLAAIFIAALAAFLFRETPIYPPLFEQVQGRNNTALFVVNVLSGLHNVQMATIQALREKHPEVEVHVASWALVEPKVQQISDGVGAGAAPIAFHSLSGKNFLEAAMGKLGAMEITEMIVPGDLAGAAHTGKLMQSWMSPWDGPEHLAVLQEIGSLMDTIDPAIVVVDPFVRPAIDAAREKQRLHSFVVPNMVIDNFPFDQPWGAGYWKYPALGSTLPFPVPWARIPQNIWHALQIRYAMSWTPELRALKTYLRDQGVRSSDMDFYAMYRPDTPWITQALPGGSIPADYVPSNVTCTGPILLGSAPAAEQDPGLTAWLAQGPTVLINLGNMVTYDQSRALTFTQAITSLLDERPQLQVLWKFNKAGEYPDDFQALAKKHIDSGRFRLTPWLHAEPFSLLETGHIAAFVHHGGAGSYHEGLATGVPHVVLPLWVDHYNIATLVNELPVGVWACPETSPGWTAECIASAISSVIDDTELSKSVRQRAAELAEVYRSSPGRDGAAQIIAELAASGHA